MTPSWSPPSAVADWFARWSPFATLPAHIVASEIRAVESPVHANQRVEKSFTVSKHSAGSLPLAESGVLRLSVQSPGLTVVRVRPELLDEVGPDVVARVRVTSDAEEHLERLGVYLSKKHALTIDYTAAKAGTLGHLVTEIDVAHADQVHRVVAKCQGDVVVEESVVGTKFTPTTPALVSLLGARLVLATRGRDLACDDLVVGCLGGGSVHVDAPKLKATTLFAAGVLGGGRVCVDTSYFSSNVTLCAALGDGATQLTARRGFHSARLIAHQRGAGSVSVLPAPNATVTTSQTQRIRASHSGLVDLAGVPSYATQICVFPALGCVVRAQVPHADWWSNASFRMMAGRERGGNAILQYAGAPLPASFANGFPFVTFEQIGETRYRYEHIEKASQLTVPTIADAFERPVALENVRESWLADVLAPTLRSLLPVDI